MIAFTALEQELARQVQEARLDHEAFGLPIKVCELSQCRATCCHDGVYLDTEEREVIGSVIEGNREPLASYGWNEPTIFERQSGRWKSVTLPDPGHAPEFPSHFPQTRCVFLDRGHRCVLQRLAMDQGKHPWFWKPISCWMHPLILESKKSKERPILTLATPENDPASGENYPGFSSYTPCGTVCPKATAARLSLSAELALLGEIGRRDILAELNATGSNEKTV
jgi:hypothetical protein